MLIWILHHLWGLKTVALFDVWSIEHIASGVSIGIAVHRHTKWELRRLFPSIAHACHSLHFDLAGVLFLGYLWETIEHYLESGIAGAGIEYWFQGIEYWPNRILTDPALLIVGYLIAKRYPRLVIPARVFSLVWLLVHVFLFPHSMYLQEFLGT